MVELQRINMEVDKASRVADKSGQRFNKTHKKDILIRIRNLYRRKNQITKELKKLS